MHCLVSHISFFVKSCGSVKWFTGQALEKTMDDIKHVFRTKTSKHDAAKDPLIVRKRIEKLYVEKSKVASQKRAYEKKDEEFWQRGKSELCAIKRRKIEEEVAQLKESMVENIENM